MFLNLGCLNTEFRKLFLPVFKFSNKTVQRHLCKYVKNHRSHLIRPHSTELLFLSLMPPGCLFSVSPLLPFTPGFPLMPQTPLSPSFTTDWILSHKFFRFTFTPLSTNGSILINPSQLSDPTLDLLTNPSEHSFKSFLIFSQITYILYLFFNCFCKPH